MELKPSLTAWAPAAVPPGKAAAGKTDLLQQDLIYLADDNPSSGVLWFFPLGCE